MLIYGGTSSVAIAAIQLAKNINTTVIATTRNKSKTEFLKNNGVDFVLVQKESFENDLKKIFPRGVDKISQAHKFLESDRADGKIIIKV